MTEQPTDPMNGQDEYLWDPAASPDPEVEAIERALVPLAADWSARARDLPASPPRRPVVSRTRVLLAAAITLAAIAWIAVSSRTPRGWSYEAVAGRPSVGDMRSGLLPVGTWLETDEGSEAQLHVASIGNIHVHPGSRLRIVAAKNTVEHRMEMTRGRIEAFITAPPRLFFVETPSAVAVDLGCAYELVVDENGSGLLNVTFGEVALERDTQSVVVPSGAACRLDPDRGPGTPWFGGATRTFLAALDRADAGPPADADVNALLADARHEDTLTLWHLLPRCTAVQRERVVARMTEFGPLPAGKQVADAIALDEATLDAWYAALKRTW